MPDTCELCDAVPLTRRWHEDPLCWIAECESCGVPMVVWRLHGASPPSSEVDAMVDRLRSVAREVFSSDDFFVDRKMRQIPDHFHAHARLHWQYPYTPRSTTATVEARVSQDSPGLVGSDPQGVSL